MIFLFVSPPSTLTSYLCTGQITTTHLQSALWQRSNSKLSVWQRSDEVHIPKQSRSWLLFIPPTLPSADPWMKANPNCLCFLRSILCFLISRCSITQAPDLHWVSFPSIIYLMPYSFPKSQLCGLHCECFQNHPQSITHSYITILKFSISLSLLWHVLPTTFFLVFIIPRNLPQQDFT